MSRRIFRLISRERLEWLRCLPLARERSIVHAFSTRRERVGRASHRDFTLGRSAGAEGVQHERNGRRLFSALAVDEFRPALLRQIHSSNFFRVKKGAAGRRLEFAPPGTDRARPSGSRPAGDALLTDEPGILLGIRVADCMPILIADPRRRAVAAVHVGWRGALSRIVEKAVGEMRRTFGSRAEDLLVAIGPSIRACCYEVGEEVVAAFCGRFVNGEKFFCEAPRDQAAAEIARRHPLLFLSKAPPGHGHFSGPSAHLDLVAVARDQLTGAGVDPSKVHVADFCTACRTDLFFSYRKEGTRAGRMMAVIGINPKN